MAQGDRGNFDRNRNARSVAEALAARKSDTNRLRNTVFDALVNRVGAQTAGTAAGVTDLVPFLGDVSGAEDTYQAARGGDYKGAAIAGAATLMGLVPGVGDAASKIVRKSPTMADAYMGDNFAGTISVSSRFPFVSGVEVPAEYRGRGIGRALYAEAEEMAGKPLFPSPLGLTDDALRVWRRRLEKMPPEEANRLLDDSQNAGEAYGISPARVAERLAPLRGVISEMSKYNAK